MAELADALDLGSSGQPCRFKSCWPHTFLSGPGAAGWFAMKRTFLIELSVLTVIIIFCIFRSFRSKREIARPTAIFLCSIVVPLLGNIIIASSEDPAICNAGYILFLLGTNLVIFTLIDFTLLYCSFPPLKKISWVLIIAALTADSVSVFLNVFFQHCYTLEETVLETGEIYYILKSGLGHYIHLSISAVLLVMIAGYYIWRILTSAVLYLEKYLVILLSILIVSLWEYRTTLLDRTIDHSMIGLAVGGILLYFFAIEYRAIFLKIALHDLLIANMQNAVLFFDKDGEAIYANKSASSLFGITPDSLDNAAGLLGEEITGVAFIENSNSVEHGSRWLAEVRDGDNWKYYDVTCQRLEDRRGTYLGTFFGISDDTEVEQERRERSYRQTHDELTGMVNREMFIDLVKQKLEDAPETEYTMILSDISDFKMINDIYGRDFADRILQEIADLVRRIVPEEAVYCRWGADRFAVFTPKGGISPEDLENRIRAYSWSEGSAKNLKHPLVMHAGYYEITDRSLSVSSMIDRCIMAISEVRDDYQRLVCVYDEGLRRKRLREQKVNADLPEALKSGQILPYLQPQYDRQHALTGAEVLVRWQHPEEGLLAPSGFIPIFEKNGMIVKLDTYIWEEACRILASWKGTGREHLHLSVNISPKDFYFIDPYETFTQLVEKYGLAPEKLHLEVTETVVMNNAAQSISSIRHLREYGFIVEMDDFGSGYSSLNLLRDMPVDTLKIDMGFLGKTSHPKKAETILSSIIELAHHLNMTSIAEGVEQEEQLRMLTQMGCTVFQGYYFAKPMPLSEFEEREAGVPAACSSY